MSAKYENQIGEIRASISELLKKITEANQSSLDAYENPSEELFQTIQEKLNNTSVQGDIIDNEIIKTFALYGPEANELRTLVSYLKMTNEIVRIGEGVKKYAKRMQKHSESACDLTPLNATIIQLHKSTINALAYITECFASIDECNIEDFYAKIMVEESKSDDLFAILETEIMEIISAEKELAPEYVKVLGTLRKLERSCDRSVNIANLILYAKKGGEIHQYS